MEMKNWKWGTLWTVRRRGAQDQFLVSSLQAEIGRRIDAVGQVDADRADGRAVADAEAGGVHHVIEILHVALVDAEGDAAEVAVDVAHVVENDAVDVVAQQREAQLGGVEEQRVAAEMEAGLEVARAGLVVGEAAMRRAAAAEEVLGDRAHS